MPNNPQNGKTTIPAGVYPDAYCVNCKSKKTTLEQKTVFLKNNARAMRGKCANCGTDVYRFLGKKDKRSVKSPSNTKKMAFQEVVKTVISKSNPLANIQERQASKMKKPNRPVVPVNKSFHSISGQQISLAPQNFKKLSRKNMSRNYHNQPASSMHTILLTLILVLAATLFVMGNAYIMLK